MIWAILEAQWRSMRTFRTSAAAAVFGWLSRLLFYGFWTFGAVGAMYYFQSAADATQRAFVLSAGLLAALLYWQITPVITASMGGSLDLKKLLAYPIPHQKLFAIELLLRITVCLEVPMVLVGTTIGLLRNPETGGVLRGLVITGAVLLFMAINILLSAGLRSLLERALQGKRTRELGMFLVLAFTVVPQFLLVKRFRESFNPALIPDAAYLPWSAAAHLMLGRSFALPLVVLLMSVAAAYLFARRQFEISLRFDGSSAGGKRLLKPASASRWDWAFRWPALIVPDPVAAIVEKELRSLLRTPQFRFIFLTGAAFGLIIYLPQLMSGGRNPRSFMSGNIVTFASVYGVLMLGNVSYSNCFGFERSAAQAWYSFPVTMQKTLLAKNLAAFSLILVEIILVNLTALALRFTLTPQKLFENVFVALICGVYLIAFGNLASVRMPSALNPEKVSQGGGAKAKNVVLLLFFPIVVLPVILAYWARAVFQSDLVFLGILAFAAVLGIALYVIGLDSAVSMAWKRREQILTELSRGDGPVSVA